MHTGTHAGMLTEMGMLTGTRAEMGTGTHGHTCRHAHRKMWRCALQLLSSNVGETNKSELPKHGYNWLQ